MRLVPLALLMLAGALAAPVHAQVDGVLHVGDSRVVSKPAFDPDNSPLPDYPREAKRANQEGVVVLLLCVSETGSVTKQSILRSSSHERLDQASLDWIPNAVFTPARTVEGPVAVCDYPLTWTWELQGDTFPPFQPLGNAFALGLSKSAKALGEPLFDKVDELEGATPPAITLAPLLPIYPGGTKDARGPAAIDLELCVAPQGRAVTVSGLGEIDTHAGILAMTWLNGLRFSPATQHGEPVGVCGVKVRLKWR